MRRILPSSVPRFCPLLERVAVAAAVAHADVEDVVGADDEVAAVVVAVGAMRDHAGAGAASRGSRRCRSSCTRRCGCRRGSV